MEACGEEKLPGGEVVLVSGSDVLELDLVMPVASLSLSMRCRYELAQNKPAFRAESMTQLEMRIRKANHAPFEPRTSSKLKSAVKKALTVDAAERPSAATVTRNLIDTYHLTLAAADHLPDD